ncbi:hypothetical protein [Streptomyces sp. NPDC058457]|uniref:hypothetical protein n=1 Tax=Streptomyces sp. NPDC058457 TaxID=3346507 RepID=UPI00365DBAFA
MVVTHSLVQRALTGALPGAGTAVPPPRKQRPGGAPVAQALLVAVVRGALSYDRGPRRRLIPLLPRLPLVVGLRLFPRSGGSDELTLALRLSGVTAADRAAFLLRTMHGLSDEAVRGVLTAAGARHPDAALRTADTLGESAGPSAARLLASPELNACALQASPTVLLRRRRRVRLGLAAGNGAGRDPVRRPGALRRHADVRGAGRLRPGGPAAEQDLPDGGGQAVWTCARADSR